MIRYILVILVLMLFVCYGYCQDNQDSANEYMTKPNSEEVFSAQEAGEKTQPQELSIYGEVKSVNPTDDSVSIQYYNYAKNKEDLIIATIDNNTNMPNARTVDDIKQGDWVDVTYTMVNGKNIASSITVKTKDSSAVGVPASE